MLLLVGSEEEEEEEKEEVSTSHLRIVVLGPAWHRSCIYRLCRCGGRHIM